MFPSNSQKHLKDYKIKDKDHLKDLNLDGSIVFNRNFENMQCEDVERIKPEKDGTKLRAAVNMTTVR